MDNKGQYQRQSNAVAFIVGMIVIIIIGAAIYLMYTGKISTSEIKMPGFGNNKVSLVNPPDSVSEWCLLQDIGDDNRIIGWDNKEGCCVREYYGTSQCIEGSVRMQYCYTADVGGTIKYSRVNGYFTDDKNAYIEIINDMTRENVNCTYLKEIYPGEII